MATFASRMKQSNIFHQYAWLLPLHQSQRELTGTDGYTDFSLDLRPTADFIGELFSHDKGLEVLEPADLRQRISRLISEMGSLYLEGK